MESTETAEMNLNGIKTRLISSAFSAVNAYKKCMVWQIPDEHLVPVLLIKVRLWTSTGAMLQ